MQVPLDTILVTKPVFHLTRIALSLIAQLARVEIYLGEDPN